MMLIFLILIIAGGYYLINNIGNGRRGGRRGLSDDFVSGGTASALEILKKRYAEGEITLSEYEDMKDAILDEEDGYYE